MRYYLTNKKACLEPYLLIWAALGRLHCSLWKFNVYFATTLPCLVNLEYGTQAIRGQLFLSPYEKSCATFLHNLSKSQKQHEGEYRRTELVFLNELLL